MGVDLEEGRTLVLPRDEAHHIKNVLRGKSGDVFEIADATQNLFIARLEDGDEASIVEKLQGSREKWAEVALYQAVPKGKHMDLVIEKATEIGVENIVPLVTERSVVRPAGEGKVERWRRIALSAARQSLQLRVPNVVAPITFDEALAEAGEQGILMHNEPDLPPLEKVVATSAPRLFVGPEGGWSEAEVARARENGFSIAQLGPFRLRSETAGIVAVARAVVAAEKFAGKQYERGAGS